MEHLTETLKALGDPNRLKMVSLLLQKDCCVGSLSSHLDISKGAVSQHLQVLRKAGLVSGEKRGYFTHYRVNQEKLKETVEKLLDLPAQLPLEPCSCAEQTHDEHQCCAR